MNLQRRPENPLQTFCVVTPDVEREITLGGPCHRRIHEGEQYDHPADHIVDSIIVESQYMENHTAGVERHGHGEEHPEVKHQGVLGYAFVVVQVVRHHSIRFDGKFS